MSEYEYTHHVSDLMLGGNGFSTCFATEHGTGTTGADGEPSSVDACGLNHFGFLDPVYGWLIRVPDLTPNVGIFW